MADEVKGIMIHADKFKAISRLSDEQRGCLLLALISDAGFCEMPDMDFPTSLVFDMVIPSVHQAQENYLRRYRANVENGKKGGRPKKAQSENQEPDGSEEKPMGFEGNQSVSEENPKNQIREEKKREEKKREEPSNTDSSSNLTISANSAPETVLRGKKKTLRGKRADTFERFWEAFAYKKDRAQAIDAWAAIPALTDALVDRICEAARREAENRPELEGKGRSPQYAQGWLNGRRWEDEATEETCNIIRLRGKRTYA